MGNVFDVSIMSGSVSVPECSKYRLQHITVRIPIAAKYTLVIRSNS